MGLVTGSVGIPYRSSKHCGVIVSLQEESILRCIWLPVVLLVPVFDVLKSGVVNPVVGTTVLTCPTNSSGMAYPIVLTTFSPVATYVYVLYCAPKSWLAFQIGTVNDTHSPLEEIVVVETLCD